MGPPPFLFQQNNWGGGDKIGRCITFSVVLIFFYTICPACAGIVHSSISHSQLIMSMSKATGLLPRKPPCQTVGPPHRNKQAARGLPKRDARGSSAWSASWALHTMICDRGFFVGPPHTEREKGERGGGFIDEQSDCGPSLLFLY